MWIAFVVTLVPLVFVLFTVIAKGIAAISWQFLTGSADPAQRDAARRRRHGAGGHRHAG